MHIIYHRFCKKKKRLSGETTHLFQDDLQALEKAIADKNRQRASELAHKLESNANTYLKKTFFDHAKELVGSLVFALVVAVFVRQMWFEFYVIPSGSMRPTLKEEDMLVVSKTDYGINTPMRTSHFYFNPELVKRGDIVVFSGAGMDISDVDTMYFYIIPGKKQLVKRMIGKPGDTLYFYGGKIYGIDKDGNNINEFQQDPWFEQIEHIPFITFTGKEDFPTIPTRGVYSPIIIYQMNEAVARLSLTPHNKPFGTMLPQQHKDNPIQLADFFELWGFKNYAMARMLSPEQLQKMTKGVIKPAPNAVMYIQLKHHPSLRPPRIAFDSYNQIKPSFNYEYSYIPLDQQAIDKVLDNMVTCRFVVKNGKAYRLGANSSRTDLFPNMPNVPDGTYEFDQGKAYKVYWLGILKELDKNHPLCSRDPKHIQLLYNLGMDFNIYYEPSPENPNYPTRYAYYRDKQFYLMATPIYEHKNPSLQELIQAEKDKQTVLAKYPPFIDYGPPVFADGSINKELIRNYGIKVPETMYLVLGDNHAMSGDSRVFGFLPQDNIRGATELIFWPPGSRFGRLFQPEFSIFIPSRIIIWILALLAIFISWGYHRKKMNKPLRFD